MKTMLLVLAVGSLATLASVQAQDHPSLFPPDKITWGPGPAALPPGAKMIVMEGDPSKEGAFTVRFQFPDGYKVQPHTHPKVEHVTVISGQLNLGMGDKFDESATQPLTAGTFGFWPAGMKHFAWAKGETVIQLHGVGPWTINYLNPADDPRQKK